MTRHSQQGGRREQTVSSLSKIAEQKGIRYFLVSFTDLRGVQRAKLVPAAAIDRIAAEGAGFAGFATWLDMTPADPDMLGVGRPEQPDPAALEARGGVGGGRSGDERRSRRAGAAPGAAAPDRARRASCGYAVRTGVECEFFVLSPDGELLGDGSDLQGKPCYDQQALMRRYDLIAKICDSMLALGWEPYQNDHEDANGQFEMNWTYSDALITADRHAFFKYMVKTLAESSRAARDLHAQAVLAPVGQRLPRARLGLGRRDRRRTCFATPPASWGCRGLAYQFMGGVLAPRRGAVRAHQPDRELVQAHQRARPPPRAPPGHPTPSATPATTART